MGDGRSHILCFHIFAVVAHMDTGDVDVIHLWCVWVGFMGGRIGGFFYAVDIKGCVVTYCCVFGVYGVYVSIAMFAICWLNCYFLFIVKWSPLPWN